MICDAALNAGNLDGDCDAGLSDLAGMLASYGATVGGRGKRRWMGRGGCPLWSNRLHADLVFAIRDFITVDGLRRRRAAQFVANRSLRSERQKVGVQGLWEVKLAATMDARCTEASLTSSEN